MMRMHPDSLSKDLFSPMAIDPKEDDINTSLVSRDKVLALYVAVAAARNYLVATSPIDHPPGPARDALRALQGALDATREFDAYPGSPGR